MVFLCSLSLVGSQGNRLLNRLSSGYFFFGTTHKDVKPSSHFFVYHALNNSTWMLNSWQYHNCIWPFRILKIRKSRFTLFWCWYSVNFVTKQYGTLTAVMMKLSGIAKVGLWLLCIKFGHSPPSHFTETKGCTEMPTYTQLYLCLCSKHK